jgi:hypothetical protein
LHQTTRAIEEAAMYPDIHPLSLQITEEEILADLSWPFPLPGDWQPAQPATNGRRPADGSPTARGR